jgi:1,4-alpha-glucan branching enzyme
VVEGPQWLEFLIRKIACDQDTIRMITPSEYLAEHPRTGGHSFDVKLGYKGYSEMWLQGPNDGSTNTCTKRPIE